MREIPLKLELPMFMLTRNRLKIPNRKNVRSYIQKQHHFHTCVDDDEKLADEFEQFDIIRTECNANVATGGDRSLSNDKAWSLSPNRYGYPAEAGRNRMGKKGANWSRLPRVTGTARRIFGTHRFYEIPKEIDRFQGRCLGWKGKFLTDPRQRKPTSRFMVNSVRTCYRNPTDAGPANYFPKNGSLDEIISKSAREAPPLIYKFLPNSCVPEKKNSIHQRANKGSPAPGRYDVYDIACPCGHRHVFDPTILLKYERAKRLRFRRLPYKKIYLKSFCFMPYFRHVRGGGFPHLFKSATPRMVANAKPRQAAKTSERQLYASSKYIQMITNPQRKMISTRTAPPPRKPLTIRYNVLSKHVTRRQLKSNKKIAFLSGVPRWKDMDGPKRASGALFEKKEIPILEPSTSIRPKSKTTGKPTKSRLLDLPVRLQGTQMLVRETPFNFSPLPPPKMLVDDREFGYLTQMKTSYFSQGFKPEMFFKDEFVR